MNRVHNQNSLYSENKALKSHANRVIIHINYTLHRPNKQAFFLCFFYSRCINHEVSKCYLPRIKIAPLPGDFSILLPASRFKHLSIETVFVYNKIVSFSAYE
jgi:hypothetical protein